MRRLLQISVTLCSIAIFVVVVAGYFGGFVFKFDVLAHFRLHLLILCLPVAVLALALRNWSAFWRSLVTAVIALAGLGVLWEAPDRDGGTMPITIMAANLYQDNTELEEMKRALLSADADVLVTMETTKATMTGENSLALKYPYRLSLSTSGQTLRTVIWSRFPMRDGHLLLEDLVEPTGAHAVISVKPNVEFTLLGVHFAHNLGGNQRDQIEALDLIAESLPNPLVIIGDFNATAWSHALRRVEDLTATKRVGGFRITWRGAYPGMLSAIKAPIGLQIDHALVSESIGVRSIRTLTVPGSDHMALLADLSLPEL